jgi:uncharacterized damage-inducible protein DinB
MAENVGMEIERRHVAPLDGFSKEIGYYLTSFQFGREQTKELLEDLTPEEIAKRYLPEMHSIGALAMHLGECEYWYFQSIAGERALTDDEIKFCHFCDTTENDVDRGYTAEYLIETLDAVSAKTREFLTGLTDEDLDKFHPRTDVTPPRELSLRWLLQLSIDHEGHHRGQIAMLKRLIRGGTMAS